MATKSKLPTKWMHAERGTGGGESMTSCLKFDHTGFIY